MARVLSIVCFLSFQIFLNAQNPLTHAIDSLPNSNILVEKKKKKISIKRYFKEDYPSPKKAVILGIIPGMGQIYNKKYWKLPLVYGALGGVVYSIINNTRNFNQLQNSLDVRNNMNCQNLTGTDIPEECMDPLSDVPINAITANRNSSDKNRQVSWIAIIGFYLISAGDAFVDAHLKDFNVNDDISFQPILETGYNNQPLMGIGLTIPIGQ